MVYLEIESESSSVKVLNAGHFPPMIIRQSGLDEMPKGGAALGILPDAQFEEQCADIQSGDVIVIYSDGVTEARDADGRFWGEQRLANFLSNIRALPPEAVGGKLLNEIDRFIGSARPHDDLSLVILKRL